MEIILFLVYTCSCYRSLPVLLLLLLLLLLFLGGESFIRITSRDVASIIVRAKRAHSLFMSIEISDYVGVVLVSRVRFSCIPRKLHRK